MCGTDHEQYTGAIPCPFPFIQGVSSDSSLYVCVHRRFACLSVEVNVSIEDYRLSYLNMHMNVWMCVRIFHVIMLCVFTGSVMPRNLYYTFSRTR